MQINWEEQLVSEKDCATQGSSVGKESLRTYSSKNLWGVVAAGETPSLTGEFVGGARGVLECTQTHQPGNQHQQGPICWWVMEEVIESQ